MKRYWQDLRNSETSWWWFWGWLGLEGESKKNPSPTIKTNITLLTL